jgi:hypothetical protein
MPPLKRVQTALRQATERFAAELAAPADEPPDWSAFEWAMAKAAAVLHGVAPLLATTLRWRGPPQWCRFIFEQYQHTALRHQRIVALLERINESAQGVGVAAIALKGAALHALGYYSAGQRPMADIDLLVCGADVRSMTEILETLGYRETSATWKHRIFAPREKTCTAAIQTDGSFGENEHTAIKIELHTRVAERLPLAEVDVTELVLSDQAAPGLSPYPSNLALMSHLLLHAAGNAVTRSLRLIHLHDIALLAARLSADEWTELARGRVAGRPLWWALPPLELLQRYYGGVPYQLLRASRNDCPRALQGSARRQLISDVSYASLREAAFPGLTWIDSFSEKFRYIRVRVRPDADQRAMLEVIRSEPWTIGTGWSRQTRRRRLLRWLWGPPPRPPSMYIVQAALAASERPLKAPIARR